VKPNQDYYLPEKSNYVSADQKPGGLDDPNAFLKILVAQMKYQNPMEPTNSDTFINQLTQMASMEQMANVSTSMNNLAVQYEMSRDFEMIGQQVTLRAGNNTIRGIVGGVEIVNKKPYFYLAGEPQGNRYTLDQVTGINKPADLDILPYLALVGQSVKVANDNGEFTGLVDKILFNNGNPLIQVNGDTFDINDILEIINPYETAANQTPAQEEESNASSPASSDPETTAADSPEIPQ